MNNVHTLVLAAGEGKRMRSAIPKVLQPLGGRPMLAHLLDAVSGLGQTVAVVVGAGGDRVRQACADRSGVEFVEQTQRLGTGHAVQQALPALPGHGRVLILPGDMPLVRRDTLEHLLTEADGPLTLLTAELDDATGYGRIVRGSAGQVVAIVEQRDATAEQLAIREINTGVMVADLDYLPGWLDRLNCDNAQSEYYLTDIVAMAAADGRAVTAVLEDDPADLAGANDRAQLAQLERRLQQRCCDRMMADGATLADPARVDIRGRVSVGRDVMIDVNVVLTGEVALGDGVRLGPGVVISDCRLGPGTEVAAHSVLEGVETTGPCVIGPFARLRPGTRLAAGARIGNFVETKNTVLGQDSKASHLSYLGDAQIGDRVNIGAGTITCNYDGANKHPTVIEDEAFIGSDSQLVAPVTIGAGATVGAGSTITRKVPAGHLAVSRQRQTHVEGWRRPRKKGN